ncbi:MAG: glycosyltransferase family 4 protein [Chloroflexota bacterium]
MRLCIATGTFPPDIGGPPTYLSQLIPALASRGHTVHVVTYGEPATSTLPCTTERISRRATIPVRLARFTRAVLAGTRDADILFVSDYGLPPAVVNRLRGLPMVIKVVGDFAWEYSVRHGHVPPGLGIDRFQSLPGGPRVRILKTIQRAYVSAAQRVIVPSYYLKSIVAGWGVSSRKMRVIYNAVPLPATRATSLGATPLVLTVARLAPWKGIDTLILAIGRLKSMAMAPKLVVAGDGADRERLEQLAARVAPNQVTFLGEIERSGVQALMSDASILALASGYEGLSHVLLEGMAAGLPIVASNIDGNRELISHGENGWLVQPGDDDGFAQAIRNCLGDPEVAQAYGRRNRAWAESHGIDQQVDRTLEVCLEAIAERRR